MRFSCDGPRLDFNFQPAIERVQALADISRSALCCHTNENRAPIANTPNSAQLEGTPTIPQVTSGSVQYGEGQTYTDGRGQYPFRLGYAVAFKTTR